MEWEWSGSGSGSVLVARACSVVHFKIERIYVVVKQHFRKEEMWVMWVMWVMGECCAYSETDVVMWVMWVM